VCVCVCTCGGGGGGGGGLPVASKWRMSLKMKAANKFYSVKLWARILDFVLIAVVLGVLGLSYSGLIPPRGAGFYCDDQTIKHTYRGDTISVINLFFVTLFVPILFIFPIEVFEKKRKYADDVRSYVVSGWRKSWKIWQALLLGELLVLMLTEFSKSIVSEARPHFWDTCKPNVSQAICDTGYIVDFSCTSNFTKNQILDSQKSFPSGHTSVSVFAMVFMVCYLGAAVKRSKSVLLVPFMQLIWVCFGFYCSLTRITDRRHHWWDVLAGATLGFAVALVLKQAIGRIISPGKLTCDDSMVESPQKNDSSADGSLGQSRSSPSKRPSVRRLLSTSSISSISENPELNMVPTS